MAGAKEIRTKIKSIRNTQKITRAMEMVAASKMRRAQETMAASRPYADHIRSVIGHLAEGRPEYHHRYLEMREVKREGYIVVSTDRGLCGGLNINLFKQIVQAMANAQTRQVSVDLCLVGTKADGFFKRVGGNIVAHAGHLGDKPTVTQLIGVVKIMIDKFLSGSVDRVYIVYNRFVNTMTQKPEVLQLLPLQPLTEQGLATGHWDYIYEPDAKELLDGLLTRFIESQVYQSVVENIACEQAARMVAMKAASDNAGDIIGDLQLVYNKARQAAITQELSEIIGGASAV